MNRGTNGGVFFLHDEEFDFDVSLSPASSNGEEDEDEVFVGAVTHTEKCVSVHVESQLQKAGVRASWSPLTGDQLEAVCEEAHKLANQLQSGELSEGKEGGTVDVAPSAAAATKDTEVFVQDAESKVGVFAQPASALSPIKRQTFCVQDSPMKQLPPAIQRRLLSRGSTARTPPSNRAPPTRRSLASTNSLARSAAVAATTTKQGTSTPAPGPKAPTRSGLRGRTSLGVGVVLPSRPAAPNVSAPASRSQVEKTRLQAPVKMTGGWKRSPSSQPSSKAGGSSEDLLSDSASVASDVSDTSANSSLLGKRTIAPPAKGVRNSAAVKAPRLQSRSMTDRKNTSSSSSSVSSFNSSMSMSPTKGKLNSSLNQSSCFGPAPGSISRPAANSRARRPTIGTVEPVPSSATAAGRRSLSTQARKPQELERVVKAARSTPLKKAEATPIKRVLERTASVPTVASTQPLSSQRPKSKPEAMVAPTPVGGGRRLSSRVDVSNVLKPKRLVSVSSLDSVPKKPVLAAPSTPSAGRCQPLQAKSVRPTGLPTPVKRRMSTLPLATPTNPNRTARSQLKSDSSPVPVATLATAAKSCSPAPSGFQEAETEIPVVQTLHLDAAEEEVEKNEEKTSDEEVEKNEEKTSDEEQPQDEKEHREAPPPAAASSSPPQPDQSESTDAAGTAKVQPEPSKNLIELEIAEEKNSKTLEVLLLDLPAPALHPQEKLLIDLTNTPNLIRTNNKTCTGAQLIDLSSPLIKWSPEDKRENNAPLINLSF